MDLDKEVAEKVMGWTYSNGDYYRVIMDYYKKYTLGSQLICDESEFKPSTRIAHAWNVVKEMKKHKFRFDMSTQLNGDVSVAFELMESEYDLFYTELKERNAELAICKCALEAMERLNKNVTG